MGLCRINPEWPIGIFLGNSVTNQWFKPKDDVGKKVYYIFPKSISAIFLTVIKKKVITTLQLFMKRFFNDVDTTIYCIRKHWENLCTKRHWSRWSIQKYHDKCYPEKLQQTVRHCDRTSLKLLHMTNTLQSNQVFYDKLRWQPYCFKRCFLFRKIQ